MIRIFNKCISKVVWSNIFSHYHHIPNIITIVRFLLAPLIAFLIVEQRFEKALLVLLLAGMSDGLDGLIARQWECTSSLGAIIDPIADKMLMILAYGALWGADIIPTVVMICVVGRDILMLVVSLWIYSRSHDLPIHVTRMSKINTFCQIAYAITVLALQSTFITGHPPSWFLWGISLTVSLTTICSGLEYAIYYGKWLRAYGQHEHDKRI